MGLPLFVAPVESDLSHNAARKDAGTSPRRSAIRRLAHIPSTRERAILNRRARTFEHHEQRRGLPGVDEIDSIMSSSSPPDVASVARYISMGFTSPTDIARQDARQDRLRATLRVNMDIRFGTDWRDRNWEHPQRDLNSDWWVVETRLANGTARLTRLGGHRLDFAQSQPRPRHIDIVPSAAWGASQPAPNLQSRANRAVPPEGNFPRHPLPSDVNGLGDRERSLSPEGWDTLLTTLTPDPQPPGAESSFASTATPQGATTSNTSVSDQQASGEISPDGPCDSGCSDVEENETPRQPRLTSRIRRAVRRAERSRRTVEPMLPTVRIVHLPSYSTDGAGENAVPVALPPTHLTTLHRSAPSERNHGEMDEGLRFQIGGRPGVWVGQLSIGASDEDHLAERPLVIREDSSGSGSTNTSGRDDGELTGMQRILRSLANRQDIPEEWWAEAGLSRSLSRGGAQDS